MNEVRDVLLVNISERNDFLIKDIKESCICQRCEYTNKNQQ